MAQPKYLRVALIPCKFYVSEGWKAVERGGNGLLSEHQHYTQLAHMILSGPYDTRNEAETWNTVNAQGHANIWQY